jgi:hypothetical protein
MFQTVPLSSIRSFSLYTQQCYMSYRFADSSWAGSGCSILILLTGCQQTCMTYTIAVCIVKNSRCWTEELSETCRVSFENKFEKLVHLVGFIIRSILWNFLLPYYNTMWIFQCLRKVAKFIVEQNERVYAPRGLLITDPTERGLRVVSLLMNLKFSYRASSIRVTISITNRCDFCFMSLFHIFLLTVHVLGLHKPIIRGISSCCLYATIWFMQCLLIVKL